MPNALVIRGRFAGQTFGPTDPLPFAEVVVEAAGEEAAVVVEEPSESTETVLSLRLVTKTSPLAES